METGSETESVHEKKKILQYSENTGKIDCWVFNWYNIINGYDYYKKSVSSKWTELFIINNISLQIFLMEYPEKSLKHIVEVVR